MVTLKALQDLRSGNTDQGGKGQDVLRDMALLKMSRLSVSLVSEEEWEFIHGLVEKTRGEDVDSR